MTMKLSRVYLNAPLTSKCLHGSLMRSVPGHHLQKHWWDPGAVLLPNLLPTTDTAVGPKIQRKDFYWHMAHMGHTALPVRQSLVLSDCWTVSHLILSLNLHLKLGRWACIWQRQSASCASESAIMEHKQLQERRSGGGEKRRHNNSYIFLQASVKWQPRN